MLAPWCLLMLSLVVARTAHALRSLSKVLAYSLNASQMPEEPGSQKKIT